MARTSPHSISLWVHNSVRNVTASTTDVYEQLPYLHWDTIESAREYKSAVNRATPLPDCLDGSLREAEAGSFLAHLQEHPDTYHPRRTLDQFYYSHMENTEARDEDQVVTRRTRDGSPYEGTLIMVDQLWLHFWIVETDKEEVFSSRILTAFPYTNYARRNITPEYTTLRTCSNWLSGISRPNTGRRMTSNVPPLSLLPSYLGQCSLHCQLLIKIN